MIDVDDLPSEVLLAAGEQPGAEAGHTRLLELTWLEAKDRFEELYFKSALARHGGAVQQTAKATGVDRRTLSTKIARHRLRRQGSG